MQWFDRFLYRKLRDMWDNKHKYNHYLEEDSIKVPRGLGMNAVAMVDESASWEDGLRINVKKVIGGFIVSFRQYDRKTDRSNDRHYIITDEQDFNKELGNMITLESMKQSA
jgi:hypothetical protein